MFIIVNIVLGCYAAVRYGYGPPDWRTALNLVVRLTTLQRKINTLREVIDRKCPWADRMLNRLHIPKPIVIVEIVDDDELAEDSGIRYAQTDQTGSQTGISAPAAESSAGTEENAPPPETDSGGTGQEITLNKT
jgi:hypothetical protein